MKRFLAIILTCLIFTGIFNSTASAESAKNDTQLIDIKGHWAETQINTAVAKGYVSGYTDGTFKPNAEVTRAEFLKMLVAAMKLDTVAANGSWYQPYVDAATKAGYYANDFASTTWDKSIPRKEMATLAVRAGLTGYKKDYDTNRNLYEAAKNGIIQGVGKGEIAPDGVTTRASAVVVIERILDIKAGKTLATDKYATAAAEVLWHKTNILTMLPRYFSSPLEGYEIDPSKMVSTSGNLTCSVDQLVVIDMDDKNDPNMKYLTDDLYWGKIPNFYQVKTGSGFYAVLSISKLTVTSGSRTSVGPCVAEIANDDWKPTASTIDPKNPTGKYSIISFNPEKKEIKRTVNVNQGTPTYHTVGAILPKLNFKSTNDYYRITYTPLGSEAMSGAIYYSTLNEKYNQ